MPPSILAFSEMERARERETAAKGTSEDEKTAPADRTLRTLLCFTNNWPGLVWRSLDGQGCWPAFQRRHLPESPLNHMNARVDMRAG